VRIHSIQSLGEKRFKLVLDFGTFEVEIERLSNGIMTLEGEAFQKAVNDLPYEPLEYKAFMSRVMNEALALEPGGALFA